MPSREVTVTLTDDETKALQHEFSEPYGREIRVGIFEKVRAALQSPPSEAGETKPEELARRLREMADVDFDRDSLGYEVAIEAADQLEQPSLTEEERARLRTIADTLSRKGLTSSATLLCKLAGESP